MSPSPERPKWLLADVRLQTARLENENEALKKQVLKALSEIDALEARQEQYEAKNRSSGVRNGEFPQMPASLGHVPRTNRTLDFAEDFATSAVDTSKNMEARTSLRRLMFPDADPSLGNQPNKVVFDPKEEKREAEISAFSSQSPGLEGSDAKQAALDHLLAMSLKAEECKEKVLSRLGSRHLSQTRGQQQPQQQPQQQQSHQQQ